MTPYTMLIAYTHQVFTTENHMVKSLYGKAPEKLMGKAPEKSPGDFGDFTTTPP